MEKAMVLFSGGPDSTAAALWGKESGYEVELLSFLFALGRTDGEIRSAMNVAQHLNLDHTIIDLKGFLGFFGEGIRPMMHGGIRTREDKTPRKERLLPFGAGVALSMATSVAIHKGVPTLIRGATKEDGSTRPDYRQTFADTMSAVVNSVEEGKGFKILLPLRDSHKHQVLDAFKGDPELFAMTWSCTSDNQTQCGTCHACVARRLAARVARVRDGTPYRKKLFKSPLTEIRSRSLLRYTQRSGFESWQEGKREGPGTLDS